MKNFFERTVPEPNSGCLLWTAASGKGGYGVVRFMGKAHYAHRVAWFMEHGTWPISVCHKCDTPACVRADHLFAGNAKMNADDMVEKGRFQASRRLKNGGGKLSDEQVAQIRELYESGENKVQLGRRFNCSRSTIYYVLGLRPRH